MSLYSIEISVIMMNGILLSVIMMNVILLSVIMMYGIVLRFIMMNVRAVVYTDQFQYSHIFYSFTKPAILIKKPSVLKCPVTERSVPTMPILIPHI